MVVWNSMLLKIIILLLSVMEQHVRFIFLNFFDLQIYANSNGKKAKSK